MLVSPTMSWPNIVKNASKDGKTIPGGSDIIVIRNDTGISALRILGVTDTERNGIFHDNGAALLQKFRSEHSS